MGRLKALGGIGLASLAALAFACACAVARSPAVSPRAERAKVEVPPPMPPKTPSYRCEVVRTLPHDPAAFTQGLIVRGDTVLESTGLFGRSSLRRAELETGRVVQRVDLPSDLFAEGIALLRGKIYQVTWRGHRGFVYDAGSFALEHEFLYDGEGWGLTTDGEQLVLSDGTDELRFIDPSTFRVARVVRVHDGDRPVTQLNELEMVRGEIFANIWGSDQIARIDPRSGEVTGWIDGAKIAARGGEAARDPDDVMNGIAYDEARDRLYVTGKRWPSIFEVRLTKGE